MTKPQHSLEYIEKEIGKNDSCYAMNTRREGYSMDNGKPIYGKHSQFPISIGSREGANKRVVVKK